MTTETRYCDAGCGYKLLPEYGPDETTCGACLDTPTPDQITEMAYNYGTEAAHHFWQLDPAEYDHAVEWVRTAEAGTLHDNYDIPSCDDCAPADLDTRGWSWLDICLYGDSWEQGYLDETTKLCRQVIANNEGDNA